MEKVWSPPDPTKMLLLLQSTPLRYVKESLRILSLLLGIVAPHLWGHGSAKDRF